MKSIIFIVATLFIAGCVQEKPKPQLPPGGVYDKEDIKVPSSVKPKPINEAVKKKPIDESKIKKIEL